jgi:hypothetical protein
MQTSASPPTKRRRMVLPAGPTQEDEVGEPSTCAKAKFSSLSRREVYKIINTQGVKNDEGRTLCPLECGKGPGLDTYKRR